MPSTESISPIYGTGADDIISGTNRSDVISALAGDDYASGSQGNDEVWGGSGDDVLYGNNGNDVLYGSGGPNYIAAATFALNYDYPVTITFSGETAGYRNSLGYYKVDGTTQAITDVDIIWENASLEGSGGSLIQGVSSVSLDVSAGETFGVFIVSNGYSYNNYGSLTDGHYEFRDAEGARAALDSVNPALWYVAADGTETLINAPNGIYHTAGYDDDVQLNADNEVHTVGLLKADAGTITLGFEDLYGLGDEDFDDSVFTLDIGMQNALFLNAHYNGGNDPGSGTSGFIFTDNDYLSGGTGSDELYGRSGNDQLYGDSGADELHGGSGLDQLYGGTGNDLLYGNSGDDTLDGGSANDILKGGSGNDTLFGGTATDVLHGNSGDDILDGGSGVDTLYGGSGFDTLSGGTGADELHGNSGDDVLSGNSGSDVLIGGSGSDTLSGGSGADDLQGGSGNDTFITGSGRDIVNGGSGIDTVDYSGIDKGLRIDLHGKRTTGGDSDVLTSIENVIGSSGDDWFRGDLRDNALNGGAGDDILRGTKGSDLLTGGSGADAFLWLGGDLDGMIDTLTDFDVLEGDVLDLSYLIPTPEEYAISEYLKFEDDGTHTTVSIDTDGGGDHFTGFVTLSYVSGVTVDEAEQADYFVFG